MMGALRLLVRFTVRIKAWLHSFPEDEMMSWDMFWGSERVPWAGGGDTLRFDMVSCLRCSGVGSDIRVWIFNDPRDI